MNNISENSVKLQPAFGAAIEVRITATGVTFLTPTLATPTEQAVTYVSFSEARKLAEAILEFAGEEPETSVVDTTSEIEDRLTTLEAEVEANWDGFEDAISSVAKRLETLEAVVADIQLNQKDRFQRLEKRLASAALEMKG